LAVSYPLLASSAEGFIAYHLTHAQQFLSAAQSMMVVLALGVGVLVAGRAVAVSHWSQAVLGGGLAALFFVLLPVSFESLGFWSHDAFCFPAGTLLSLAVLLAVRGADTPSRKIAFGLGLASGVLTSVQLYFAAWVVGTTVALALATRLSGASWRATGVRATLVVGVAELGFVLATLPILVHYRQLAGWLWLLVSHQGIYGSGPAGLPGTDLVAANLGILVRDAPLVFIATAGSTVALAARLWASRGELRCQRAAVCAGLGFVAQLIVLFLLVGKHPGVRYLLPVAATVPLLVGAALHGLDTRRTTNQLLFVGLGLAMLIGFSVSLYSSIMAHQTVVERLQRDDAATEQVLVRVAQQGGTTRESLRTLWTYGTTAPCYALRFGDDSAARTFQTDIQRVCPRDGNLNIWNARVASLAGDISLAEYRDWDVLVVLEAESQARPNLLAPGEMYTTSIGSLGASPLVFIARR
jgi:hypothetical protein